MKKIILAVKFFVVLLALVMLTACYSENNETLNNPSDGTSNEQTTETAAETVQPNAEKQAPDENQNLSLAWLDNPDAWRYIDVAETSNHLVFVHYDYFSSEQPPDQYETVIEFFDKQTGGKISTGNATGRYIENSLEYNKETDSIQYRTISDTHYTLFIYNSDIEIATYALPDDFAAENSMGYMQDNISERLLSLSSYSFDGTPELSGENPDNAWWAVSNEYGISVMPIEGNQNSEIFISYDRIYDNFDVPIYDYDEMSEGYKGDPGETMPEIPPAHFNDVRVMNNGKNLVATVNNPMAQSGLIGLYNLNLETGEEFWYDNVFSAMMASVNYPDDKTVVAFNGDYTFIDLDTGEAEFVKKEIEFATTYDYQNYFESPVENGKGAILMSNIEKGINQEALAEFNASKLFILDVTENFVVCALEDGQCNAVRY